jgi:hypothetical protein
MFRDNMEAMQAHIDTLESAVEAERQAREAAEAKEKAAQAEARELRLRLDQRGGTKPSRLRPAIFGVTVLVAIVFLMLWLVARERAKDKDSHLQHLMRQTRENTASLTQKLAAAKQAIKTLREQIARQRPHATEGSSAAAPSREQLLESVPGLRACLKQYRKKRGSDAAWRVTPSGKLELPPEVSRCIALKAVGGALKSGNVNVRSTTIIRSGSGIKVEQKEK